MPDRVELYILKLIECLRF